MHNDCLEDTGFSIKIFSIIKRPFLETLHILLSSKHQIPLAPLSRLMAAQGEKAKNVNYLYLYYILRYFVKWFVGWSKTRIIELLQVSSLSIIYSFHIGHILS